MACKRVLSGCLIVLRALCVTFTLQNVTAVKKTYLMQFLGLKKCFVNIL